MPLPALPAAWRAPVRCAPGLPGPADAERSPYRTRRKNGFGMPPARDSVVCSRGSWGTTTVSRPSRQWRQLEFGSRNLAAAFTNFQKPRNTKQIEELTDDHGKIDLPAWATPGRSLLASRFRNCPKALLGPTKVRLLLYVIVVVLPLSWIGQGGPVHLFILVDGPRFLQPLVAPLFELVLIVRSQVINLDRQFPAKDIEEGAAPLRPILRRTVRKEGRCLPAQSSSAAQRSLRLL